MKNKNFTIIIIINPDKNISNSILFVWGGVGGDEDVWHYTFS